MTSLAAAGPSAYWYLARGTGIASLLLLTVSVVLGILGSIRFAAAPRWPRFTIDTLHRDISLLVIVLLVVHIITSVVDSFAPLRLIDSIIPFTSTYRPLWIGFGALSFDILVALVVTSMVRRRLGYKTWRAIHWLAYASWPVAVLHGLGTGSDTKVWWNLALTGACLLAVVVAVGARFGRTSEGDGARAPAMALALATSVGLAIFTFAGPLQSGWARRAGTPASLLGQPVALRVPAAPARVGGALTAPFSARLVGTVRQTQKAGGAIVDLALRLTGGARGRLRVRLAGAPIDGGGLSLTGSQVDLLAVGVPSVLAGKIVSLQGQQFLAHVTGASGTQLDLRASLNIDQQTGAVTGSLSATPVGGGGQ
jgi:sulfoxide reductase heme-binding subunit YedZ